MKKFISSDLVTKLVGYVLIWCFLMMWQGIMKVNFHIDWNFPVDYLQRLAEAIILGEVINFIKKNFRGPRS